MGRPTIIGQVIRWIDLHCGHDGHNKDYRITVTQDGAGDCRVYSEHGPAGRLQDGMERTQHGPVSLQAAMAMANDLASSKKRGRSRYETVRDESLSVAGSTSAKPKTRQPRANPTIALANLSAESQNMLRRTF